MSNSLLPLSILLLLSSAAFATSSNKNIDMVSTYQTIDMKGKTYSGKEFNFSVQCTKYDKATSSLDQNKLSYLTDGFPPECITTKIEITIQGHKIVVPKPVYEYMAGIHVRSIFVTERSDIVILHIKGGDGTWSYKSRFYFDNNGLRYKETESMNMNGELAVEKEFVREDLTFEVEQKPNETGVKAIF